MLHYFFWLVTMLFYIIVCLSPVICHQDCGLRLMTFCRLCEAHCAIIRILLAACRHATFAKLHWRLNEREEDWVLSEPDYRNPAVKTWQCIISSFVLLTVFCSASSVSLSLAHTLCFSLVLFLLLVCTHTRRPAIWLLHHITDSLCKALNSAREPEQLLTQRARPSLSPAATQPDQLSLALCCLWKLLWLNCHDFSYVCSKRLWTERNGEGGPAVQKKLLMKLWCERDRLSEERWRGWVRLWVKRGKRVKEQRSKERETDRDEREKKEQEWDELPWDVNSDRLAVRVCSVQLEDGHTGRSHTALNCPSVWHSSQQACMRNFCNTQNDRSSEVLIKESVT